MTVIIGYHSRGAGIGMEIAAARDCEQLLLDIAYSYTQAYDHRIAPDGAENLYSQYYTGSLQDILERYELALEAPQTEPPTETQPQETEEMTQAPTQAPQTVPTETVLQTQTASDEGKSGWNSGASVLAIAAGAVILYAALRRQWKKTHAGTALA